MLDGGKSYREKSGERDVECYEMPDGTRMNFKWGDQERML